MISNILKGFDIQNKLEYLFFKDQTDTQKADFFEWMAKQGKRIMVKDQKLEKQVTGMIINILIYFEMTHYQYILTYFNYSLLLSLIAASLTNKDGNNSLNN